MINSIIITKEKEITKPVYFETVVDCSENQSGKVGSGGNYTSCVIKDGQMYLKTNIDGISNSNESFYRTKFVNDSVNLRKLFRSKESKEIETLKYVYPWWVWLLGVGLVLFFGLWSWAKISKILN